MAKPKHKRGNKVTGRATPIPLISAHGRRPPKKTKKAKNACGLISASLVCPAARALALRLRLPTEFGSRRDVRPSGAEDSLLLSFFFYGRRLHLAVPCGRTDLRAGRRLLRAVRVARRPQEKENKRSDSERRCSRPYFEGTRGLGCLLPAHTARLFFVCSISLADDTPS